MSEPESNKPRQTVKEWILVVWSILLAAIAVLLFAAGRFGRAFVTMGFVMMGLAVIGFALQVTREIESRKLSWKIKEWILPVWSIVLAVIALLVLLTLDLGYVAFALIGLAIAVFALQVTKDSGTLGARVAAILGVVLNGVLVLPLLIVFVRMFLPHDHPPPYRLLCATNLGGLGSVMVVYADDHNDNYPVVAEWCDILLQENFITNRSLVCRGALASGDKGRCHYAMNPNCEPNSPPDMVLLFETKGGWNQFGGPEILTTENHGGEGCNVLFNDGSVKFVTTKDLTKLKWKVEGKDR